MLISKRKKILIIVTILVISIYAMLYLNYEEVEFSIQEYIEERQVSTCIIPDHDPFDPSIRDYIGKYRPINCGEPQLPLTYLDDEGFLHLNQSALQMLYVPRIRIQCSYQEISRPPNDDYSFKLGDAKTLYDKAKIHSASINVKCYVSGKLVYESNHLQVIPLDRELDRKSKEALEVHGVNIVILCLEATSRLNFMRQLPKTYKLITEDLDFDVFKGLTKVGDNTFPNMIVLLTGLADYNEDQTLGPFLRNSSKRGTLDDMPFLWKHFAAKHFVTMCLEDSTQISLFNYDTNGFKQPPTTYYTRPFWLSLDQQTRIVSKDKRCKGHIPKHQIFLDFYEQFIKKMHQGKNAFFSFGLLDNLSHDEVNAIQVLDDDLAAFLTRLHMSGALENTLVLLQGDHGHRIDEIRTTKIGRIEASMPFFSIHLPESLKHLRTNVRQNLNILTSWYDVFETLKDVEMDNTALQSKQLRYGNRGLSLFRPIPANRTCSELGIPQQFCICSYETDFDPEDSRVIRSAQFMIDHVNNILKPHSKLCATLSLDQIISTQLLLPYDNSDKTVKIRVLVSAKPSGAMLEALVILKSDANIIEGEVKRVNRYGKQSACVENYAIAKLYCFCK